MLSYKAISFSSPSKEKDFANYLCKKIEDSENEYFSCDEIDIAISGSETKNVKAKICIHKGEFIFTNITFLGIELGRLEITPDSIKIINRLKKTYYFNKIVELNSIVKMDISYFQIESLLLKGIVLDKDENIKKVKNHIKENIDFYCFTYGISKNVNIKSFFTKDSFLESRIEIVDDLSDFYLQALLDDYNNLSKYPQRIKVSFKRNDFIADINISIGGISYNKFEKKSFIVNSKYSEIAF